MTVQAMKAEKEQEIQNNALSVYKARVKDAEEEFNEVRAQYQKTSNKGGESFIFILNYPSRLIAIHPSTTDPIQRRAHR